MRSQADEKFMRQWEGILQKGRLYHHTLYGTIWAVLLFICVTLVELQEKSFAEAYLSKEALIKLLVWLVAGVVLYGPLIWWTNNKRYKKMKEKGS
jgi:hypothetical protein